MLVSGYTRMGTPGQMVRFVGEVVWFECESGAKVEGGFPVGRYSEGKGGGVSARVGERSARNRENLPDIIREEIETGGNFKQKYVLPETYML